MSLGHITPLMFAKIYTLTSNNKNKIKLISNDITIYIINRTRDFWLDKYSIYNKPAALPPEPFGHLRNTLSESPQKCQVHSLTVYTTIDIRYFKLFLHDFENNLLFNF